MRSPHPPIRGQRRRGFTTVALWLALACGADDHSAPEPGNPAPQSAEPRAQATALSQPTPVSVPGPSRDDEMSLEPTGPPGPSLEDLMRLPASVGEVDPVTGRPVRKRETGGRARDARRSLVGPTFRHPLTHRRGRGRGGH
jgi:hypothetical protein